MKLYDLNPVSNTENTIFNTSNTFYNTGNTDYNTVDTVSNPKNKNGRRKRGTKSKRPKSLNDYGNVPESVDDEYRFLEKFMRVRYFDN